MILRERKKPIPLQKLDAIIPRLPHHHPKTTILRQIAAKCQKGYNGERKFDYHIKGIPDQFTVLNDVTLTVFGKKVQIDSITISPRAIYIIEIKSIEGTVIFDTKLKQFIQESGEELTGYKYPITQVERIQFHLLRWLQERNLGSFPIYYYIVFSERSTMINVKGDEGAVSEVVSHVDEIPLRIMKLDERLMKTREANSQLKNKIISTIMRECEDFDYDVLGKYDIKKSEIFPGVLCSSCGKLEMMRNHGKWLCNHCSTNSKDAHIKALKTYFLLIDNYITNKEGREFLQLNNRHIVKKIFLNANLIRINGTQKWRLK